MAYKNKDNFLENVKYQQKISYRAVIVWAKNYATWSSDAYALIDREIYNIYNPPRKYTKNQYIIAEKKI